MSHDAECEFTTVPPKTGPRAGATRRFQFSVSTLMFLMLVVGAGSAASLWLGSIWVVPLALAGFSAANFILAVRRGSNWRMLRFGHWHSAVWLALGAAASGLAVHGCVDYNAIAGTDKTPGHIIQISATVLAGPLVGPVANPGAGEVPQARRWTAILFTILFMATAPFIFVRRIVPLSIACLCWITYVAATILWFFGAMISFGVFLS